MEASVPTHQTKWTMLPCMINMLPTEKERDSNNPGSTATTNIDTQFRGLRKNQTSRSLHPEGYLYKDRMDTTNIIDPHDMGLLVLQARRKGKLELFHTPDMHMNQIKHMRDKMKNKLAGRPDLDMHMWGDGINLSPSWPKVNTDGHLRFLFYNVNGISYKHNYFEMDMIMQMGGQVQADVMLITEVNLNLHQPRVRNRIRESIRAYDKYAKVQMAYPPDTPFTQSQFNMGGNMIIAQGGLSGRCVEQGADIYGRWSWISIKGKKNSIVIISGYKVGKNSGSPGGTSVAQQEVWAILRGNHRLANRPREAFDADLIDFCIQQQNKGNDIILMMDANTPSQSAEAHNFSNAANLYAIADHKFPHTIPPGHIRMVHNALITAS